ncbi:unnamed protein product [Rotaria magnacalcarata]
MFERYLFIINSVASTISLLICTFPKTFDSFKQHLTTLFQLDVEKMFPFDIERTMEFSFIMYKSIFLMDDGNPTYT